MAAPVKKIQQLCFDFTSILQDMFHDMVTAAVGRAVLEVPRLQDALLLIKVLFDLMLKP